MGIHEDNWKEFFLNANEGLGTLYDRLILEKFFDKFIAEYRITEALECPSFGMTGFSGLNSLYLAKKGVEVSICDDNPERLEWVKKLWKRIGLEANFVLVADYSNLPFDAQSFDLVWSLSALWYLKDYDIAKVVKVLGRVTKKCLFVCIHNKKQLFYPIWKMLDKDFFNYIREDYADGGFMEKKFKVLDEFQLRKRGYFVTTPWPGIILKKEQMFGERKEVRECKLDNIEIPIYANFLDNRALGKRFEKLMILEFLPDALKKYWAHLEYLIYVREKEKAGGKRERK